jgi:hypothetical protein
MARGYSERIIEEVQAVDGGGLINRRGTKWDDCQVGSDCGAGTLGQHLLVEVHQHRADPCRAEPSAELTPSIAKVGEPAAAETEKPGAISA